MTEAPLSSGQNQEKRIQIFYGLALLYLRLCLFLDLNFLLPSFPPFLRNLVGSNSLNDDMGCGIEFLRFSFSVPLSTSNALSISSLRLIPLRFPIGALPCD